MGNKLKGSLILLITAIVWGSGFIAQKLGGEAMPPITFNATRQLMAAIALLPLAVYSIRSHGYFSKENNTPSDINNKVKKMVAAGIVCGSLLLCATGLQQLGLQTVSAGKVGFISATYVVLVPLLGIFLGKRVGKKPVLCAVLALFGFAVMSLSLDGSMTKGDWLTLISAVFCAVQILAVDHFVDKDNFMLLVVLQAAGCGIFGLLIGVPLESPTLASVRNALPILLYTTFVPTCIGYPGQIIGQKYTDSNTAALILSLEAVFAAIFGAIFLKEVMSAREVLGSVIIFAAVIIGQLEKKPTKDMSED